jgi:hypothetical protein
MAKGGVNEKKQKGMEIKSANKAAKDEKAAAERSKQEAEEWKKGANLKAADRAQSAGKCSSLSLWIKSKVSLMYHVPLLLFIYPFDVTWDRTYSYS